MSHCSGQHAAAAFCAAPACRLSLVSLAVWLAFKVLLLSWSLLLAPHLGYSQFNWVLSEYSM
jgi:hypothetical protein